MNSENIPLESPAEQRLAERQQDAETSTGALKTVMGDENGQAMVEFVIILMMMVIVSLVINELFNLLVDTQMQLIWSHILFPTHPLDGFL